MFSSLGREHSFVNPRWYRYCIFADISSGVVQVIGLGFSLRDICVTHNVRPKSDEGGHIIAIGVGIHALMLTAYLILFISALVNAGKACWEQEYSTFDHKDGVYRSLSWKFKLFVVALLIAALLLLVRDAYRTIGFVDSFDGGGSIESLFAIFDGLMVSVAVLGLVLLHPSYVFTDYSNEKDVCIETTSVTISFGKLARHSVI